jgi:intracellular sulfur oxidation DsrE/DsrF family protein
MCIKTFLILTLATTTPVMGQALGPSQTGPVIDGYGPVYDVAGITLPASPDQVYRAVFDVAQAPTENDVVNARIETVARYLNMHVRAGIPTEKMEVALVLHGGAGRYALKNDAYKKRFGVDNPSLPLLDALRAAGVQIVLCGQTANSRGYRPEERAASVDLALSAMTALVMFQSAGYALISF